MTIATVLVRSSIASLLLFPLFLHAQPVQLGHGPVVSSESGGSITGQDRMSFGGIFSPFSTSWTLKSPAALTEVNGVVRDLAWSDGDLFAAGDFSVAGDWVVGYVARWDGAVWSPLGDFPSGLDGPAQVIEIDGDKVYVGGNFTQAGAIRTRNIAVWDRSAETWSDLGGGVGGTLRNGVAAIALHDGQVYVGGSFIAAGRTVAAYIARWDGRRWHRVGTGVNGPVRALYIDGDYLYAGGDFTIAGDIAAGGVARYNLNSGQWENAGVDIDGSVTALASDSRYLYVGGVFDSVAGQAVNHILRIDKSNREWSPLFKGLMGYSYIFGGSSQVKAVEDIVARNGKVYVTGTLIQASVPSPTGDGAIGLAGVAVWDGDRWSNLDPSADPDRPTTRFHGAGRNAPAPADVNAIAFFTNDSLVIGGDFEFVRNYNGAQYATPYLGIIDPTGIYRPFGTPSGNAPSGGESQGIASVTEALRFLLPRHASSPGDGRSTLAVSRGGSVPTGAARVSVPDDDFWQQVGPDASTDNGVLALAADNATGDVYAGGTFVNIFGVEANGIAVRRNREWFSLDDGTAVGVNGFVFSMAVSGSKVYVAGQFTKAGGVDANNVAVWDRNTRTWSALGSGITGDGSSPAFISEIVVRGNEVYVGGNFSAAGGNPAKSIARWNGSQWSTLGSGIDGTVNALKFFRGRLYVGGSFSGADDVNSSGVIYWDGTAWQPMIGGVNGTVNDIEAYYSFPGDTNIVIGGEFTLRVDTLFGYRGVTDSRGRVIGVQEYPYEGTDIGTNIVIWNGSGWRLHEANSDEAGSGCFSSAPVRMKDGVIRRLLAVGEELYVSGSFDDAFPRSSGSVSGSLNNVAFYLRKIFSTWVLPQWSPVKGGVNGNVNALAVVGDEIILGGDFTRAAAGTQEADHVAIWNRVEQDWTWAGNPTALAPVEALTVHDNTLYASGSFTTQELGLFEVENRLVRLGSSGWRTVDGVLQGTPFTLVSAPGSELVSGGAILTSDRKISVNVSRWNSSTGQWNALTPGSGVASLEDISFVSAVAADDENIYVGGDFDIADTLTARNVAVWNRALQSWSPLGDGLNGTVYALTLDGNGTLYAGGSFNRSGATVVNRIARWDGSAWQPLGEGVDGNVLALAVADGILYAGGSFDSAGGAPANNIARWNIATGSWSSLGAGLSSSFEPSVNAIAAVSGQLFAAGDFTHSGTEPMSNIARWHPGGWWIPLGSGTDRLVNALAPDPSTESLYAGGYFLSAGAKPSRFVGLWTNLILSVESDRGVAGTSMLREGSPNPFTTGATIGLNVPDGARRQVRLELFDPTGRKISTVAEASLAPGEHRFDLDGSGLTSGVYILRLQSGEIVESVRLVKW